MSSRCWSSLFQKEQSPDIVFEYSSRALDQLARLQKPAEMPESHWTEWKSRESQRANWMPGRIAIDRKRFDVADRTARSEQRAAALFMLGYANLQLKKYDDAERLKEMCRTVPSKYQDGAKRNLDVIRTEQSQ